MDHSLLLLGDREPSWRSIREDQTFKSAKGQTGVGWDMIRLHKNTWRALIGKMQRVCQTPLEVKDLPGIGKKEPLKK